MERSELKGFKPEWLKGASGGGGATHQSQAPIHQDEGGGSFPSRQRSQAHGATAGINHPDYDSPRYPASSDRNTYYSTSRRGGSNNTGASERPFDTYQSRGYASFGRNTSGYRGSYDGLDSRDWEYEPRGTERDREFRDRERDRGSAYGGDERERDRLDGPNFRRPIAGPPGRYDPDPLNPLRRTQSMGSGRALENGDKKPPADLSTLRTAPPTNVGTLTSSMHKAAFEKEFPSLGAQEKQGAVQSSHGTVAVLSPRLTPSWQSSSPRTDGTRPSAFTPGISSVALGSGSVPSSVSLGGSGIGGEGWSSALAEVPAGLTGTSSINGMGAGGASVPTLSAGASTLSTVGGPSLIVPKMAEALAQNPPRVRTPPQYPTEAQRFEDSVLKQSRQLIPMKPSLPKNMGAREKIKPKAVRALDVVAPQPIKLTQPLSTSQLVSSSFRPPASPRPEPLKASQGKLLVRKTSKEAVAAALSPSIPLKIDGGSSTSLVSPANSVGGLSGVVTGSSVPIVLAPPRKQKQLLDRRAVPIPPISLVSGSDGGSGPRTREGGFASEDKRPVVPTQNRSDFFNALRRKAAGAGTAPGNTEKTESGTQLKSEGVNGKDEDVVNYTGEGTESPVYEMKENGMSGNAMVEGTVSDLDTYGVSEETEHIPANGAVGEGLEGNSEQSTAPSSPVSLFKRATATEEEEAAFLRSLGWEESAEESGEGLTEEEINSFYQERIRSMSISPSLPVVRNHRLRGFQADMHVGSIGSISSGISTSDSESDDDLRVRRR